VKHGEGEGAALRSYICASGVKKHGHFDDGALNDGEKAFLGRRKGRASHVYAHAHTRGTHTTAPASAGVAAAEKRRGSGLLLTRRKSEEKIYLIRKKEEKEARRRERNNGETTMII